MKISWNQTALSMRPTIWHHYRAMVFMTSFAFKQWYFWVTKLWTICMATEGNCFILAIRPCIGYWAFKYRNTSCLLFLYFCIFIKCAIVSITQKFINFERIQTISDNILSIWMQLLYIDMTKIKDYVITTISSTY